jgi:hypothetical protein
MTTLLKKILGSALLLGGPFALQATGFAQAAPSDDLKGKAGTTSRRTSWCRAATA